MACCLIPFLWPPPHNQNNTTKIQDFIADFTRTMFRLAKRRTGATVIINSLMDPDYDLMLHSMSQSGDILNEPYTPQRMVNIFENKKSPLHDGALVIHLFDKPTIYSASSKLPMDNMHNWKKVASVSAQEANLDKLGTRHWSACSVSYYCPRAIVVVVSEERGRVSIFKGGDVELGVTKKKLVQELLTVCQEKSSVTLFQGSLYNDNLKHFKAYFSIKLFDPIDDVEWYYEHITKCRVQIFKGKEYNKIYGSAIPENMVEKCKLEEIFGASQKRLAKILSDENDNFLIFSYGPMRFGGIRFILDHETRTIDLNLLNVFVEREHFQNGLMAYILKEQFFKGLYPTFNKIAFRFESQLHDTIEKFVYALDINVDTSNSLFFYYQLSLSPRETDSSSTFSEQSTSSQRSSKVKRNKKPLTPLNESLIEKDCESLVVRVRKIDVNTKFYINQIIKRINCIQPNSGLEKQLMVADKVVAINGIEFFMEPEHLERMNKLHKCSEFVDLQISRPINCADRLQFFMDDYTRQLTLLPQ